MIIPLIMAGGKGERFWPKSRKSMPKQFVNLVGDDSMIQLTVKRLQKMVPAEHIYVVTGEEYAPLICEHNPCLPVENVIVEPLGRNTAPCIGLAADILRTKYSDEAVMAVLPSDHLIRDEAEFLSLLKIAAEAAMEKDSPIITLGIKPSKPETGYGYIQVGNLHKEHNNTKVYNVSRFVEKPDLKTAQQYLASGNHYWNSGMFVFQIKTMLRNMELHVPEVYQRLNVIRKSRNMADFPEILTNEFHAMPNISIDFGVMEKAENVRVIPGEFGWDDVGSWTSLEGIFELDEFNNATRGTFICMDSQGCIVETNKTDKLVALIGIDDIIVVDTQDAMLICAKDRAQDVKKLIDNMRKQKLEDYL